MEVTKSFFLINKHLIRFQFSQKKRVLLNLSDTKFLMLLIRS